MSNSGKSKSDRQPALRANVPQILVELHQLAAANASRPLPESRASVSFVQTMVIRGK